jgi:DNA primase catalytic core
MNMEEFKRDLDIVRVAKDLGKLPHQSGRIYQSGNCPAGHDSKEGRCFTVYPDTQSAYCFHCHKVWDVISLVQDVKHVDFLEACNWLSEKYGLPYQPPSKMSEEERAEWVAKIEERRTLFAILTEGAEFYYQTLMADAEMKTHLNSRYGLTDETITAYRLGYSKGSGLLEFLQGKGFSSETITATGLFVKTKAGLIEFFQHRLIFPFWSGGQAVYFTGRKTNRTPNYGWEQAKYKKLPTRNDERSFISEIIKNQWFYGEDSVRGAKTIYVAEGITDCLAMIQAGYGTLSPGTTGFRKDDLPRLEWMLKKVNTVYLIPDCEENQAGINGAMATAERLEAMGKAVYLVILPRAEGIEKVDVCDFLRDHGKDALDDLITQAKTPLQIGIDALGRQNLDPIRLQDRLNPIMQNLARMSVVKAEAHLSYLKGALKLNPDFMRAIRKDLKHLAKEDREDSGQDRDRVLSTLPPGIIDLVLLDGTIAYLLKEDEHDGHYVEASVIDDSGRVMIPPSREGIPFDLLPADGILKHKGDQDHPLYWDVVNKLKGISMLPSERHYHLSAVFVFFSYLWESFQYYPYLWFFGLPERGKSRIVKALIRLSFRGLYSETLNEAYLFRFADLFRGTLALDLYEISDRAQKKGSHDLLLGRYERGMKVARVTNPDKGPFRDTQYFTVSGPTILATNVEIPVKDPLLSRCIKITMPEARGVYPNNNDGEDMMELKARLLAFRMRHLEKVLPEVDKPVAGRLGDLVQPLLCVAKLLPREAFEALQGLVCGFDEDRRDAESESLAGRITQSLFDLRLEVQGGRLPVDKIRDSLNGGIDERFHVSPQTVGRELSAMGIKRKKSGTMHILWDEEVIQSLWKRYPPEGYSPNLPKLPNPHQTKVSDREIKNENLPVFSVEQGDQGECENYLPNGYPRQSGDREIWEKREITPGTPPRASLLEGSSGSSGERKSDDEFLI